MDGLILQAGKRLFPIRRAEWQGVLHWFALLAAFGFGASFARSVGMTLLIGSLGREVLPLMFMLIDLTVMLGSIVYATASRRSSSTSVLAVLLAGCVVFTLAAWSAFGLGPWSYGVFFVGFYFLLILTMVHLSTVLACYYTPLQAKRVNGFIYAGLPVGNIAGGLMLIVALRWLPPAHLVLVLALGAAIAWCLLRRLTRRLSPLLAPTAATSPRPHTGVWRQPLVWWLAAGTVLFVCYSRTVEYIYQGWIYPQAYPELADRAAFFGVYEVIANLLALAVQLLLTPLLIRRLGTGAANLVYPLLMLIGAGGILPGAGLAGGVTAQFINQELRAVLRNPLQNFLYNALEPRLWGTAKAVLNGGVFPLSTFAVSIVLMQLPSAEAASELRLGLACACAGMAGLALLVAVPQWRAYVQGIISLLRLSVLDDDLPPERLPLRRLAKDIDNGLDGDKRGRLIALETIRISGAQSYVRRVGKLLHEERDDEVRRHCLRTLVHFDDGHSAAAMKQALLREKRPDSIAVTLGALRQLRRPGIAAGLERFLLHPLPAVHTAAAMLLGDCGGDRAALSKLVRRYSAAAGNCCQQAAWLRALGDLGTTAELAYVKTFADSQDAAVRAAAVTACQQLASPTNDCHELIQKALADPAPGVVEAALAAVMQRRRWRQFDRVVELLGDRAPSIIAKAREVLRLHLESAAAALQAALADAELSGAHRFEVLALLRERLDRSDQRQLLAGAARHSARLQQVRCLRLGLDAAALPAATVGLVAKILDEIAGHELQHLAALACGATGQSRHFFDQITGNLLSADRRRSGNALEALANLPQLPVVRHLIEAWDRLPATPAAARLELGETNIAEALASLGHPLLQAALLHAAGRHTAKLTGVTKEVAALL